jgi:hypothetical protein
MRGRGYIAEVGEPVCASAGVFDWGEHLIQRSAEVIDGLAVSVEVADGIVELYTATQIR